LRKEINTELTVAQKERNIFMQDASKNSQEVRGSFLRSEVADTQRFGELDREVAGLRVQIPTVANYTSVEPNNSTLSYVKSGAARSIRQKCSQ
jgi:hypothetical protein